MIVSALDFVQIMDPTILVNAAKEGDGWLYVIGSDDWKRRRREGRDGKRIAQSIGMTADYVPRKKGWAIQDA